MIRSILAVILILLEAEGIPSASAAVSKIEAKSQEAGRNGLAWEEKIFSDSDSAVAFNFILHDDISLANTLDESFPNREELEVLRPILQDARNCREQYAKAITSARGKSDVLAENVRNTFLAEAQIFEAFLSGDLTYGAFLPLVARTSAELMTMLKPLMAETAEMKYPVDSNFTMNKKQPISRSWINCTTGIFTKLTY